MTSISTEATFAPRLTLRHWALLAVSALSGTGDELAMMALLLALSKAGVINVLGVLVAFLIPPLVLGRYVGWRLQRWTAHRALLLASTMQAATCLLIAGLAGMNAGPLLIIAAALLLAIVTVPATISFNAVVPSYFSTTPNRAYSLVQAGGAAAMVVGPLVGAGLVASLGLAWTMVIDAGSFALMALYLLTRPPNRTVFGFEPQAGQPVISLRDRSWHSGVLFGLLVTIAATAGTDVAFVYLIRWIAQDRPAFWYGLIVCFWGIGMISSARLPQSRTITPRHYILLAGAVLGAVYVGYGTVSYPLLLLPLSAIGGVANARFNATVRTLIYSTVGTERAPAAFGAYTALANGAIIVGMLVAAGFAEQVPQTCYQVGGIVVVAGCLATFWMSREGLQEKKA
jgi:MFS family permease